MGGILQPTEMSVQVVRAFARLRQLLANHKALAAKLAEMDRRIGTHDGQLAALVDAVRRLAMPGAPRTATKSASIVKPNRRGEIQRIAPSRSSAILSEIKD